MLIVVFVGAIILYGFLYFCYTLAEPQLNVSAGPLELVMRSLTEATLMPQNIVFVIFRGLLIITAFYIAADWLLAAARRKLLQAARQKEIEAEWRATGRPPQPDTTPDKPARPRKATKPKDPWRTRIESSVNTRS